MKAVHGDAEPVHRGLVPGVALGPPLRGVSAYAEVDEGVRVQSVAGRLAASNPLLITDPARQGR